MRYSFLLFLAATVWTTSSAAGSRPRDSLDGSSALQDVRRSWDDGHETSPNAERDAGLDIRDIEWRSPNTAKLTADTILGSKRLGKRRGGGGGKGGGSSSGGGKSGGTSSGGGRSTSSTSSSSPSYGGGRYYYGGATSAYSSGARSPLGITPFFLGGAALAFFPIGLYGAYAYPYSHPYGFKNRTSNSNESLPVECLCDQYSACGCDDNGNTTYVGDLLGNGSVAGLNGTLIRVATVNGTKTVFLNGTLPNGTDDSVQSAALRAVGRSVVEGSGYWLMAAAVGASVWGL